MLKALRAEEFKILAFDQLLAENDTKVRTW